MASSSSPADPGDQQHRTYGDRGDRPSTPVERQALEAALERQVEDALARQSQRRVSFSPALTSVFLDAGLGAVADAHEDDREAPWTEFWGRLEEELVRSAREDPALHREMNRFADWLDRHVQGGHPARGHAPVVLVPRRCDTRARPRRPRRRTQRSSARSSDDGDCEPAGPRPSAETFAHGWWIAAQVAKLAGADELNLEAFGRLIDIIDPDASEVVRVLAFAELRVSLWEDA